MNETTGTRVRVRVASEAAAVIDVAGDITGASEEALGAAYEEASRSRPRAVVWNFGDMEYMNSTGIGLLVTLLVRAKRNGQKMLAFGLDEHYRHIFQLTRLDEAILLCETEAAALAAAR